MTKQQRTELRSTWPISKSSQVWKASIETLQKEVREGVQRRLF